MEKLKPKPNPLLEFVVVSCEINSLAFIPYRILLPKNTETLKECKLVI